MSTPNLPESITLPEGVSSVDSINYAIPTAVIIFFLSFMLFQWENLWKYFNVVLYLGLPIIVYLLTSIVTLLAQYSGCGTVRMKDIFLYSTPSIGFTFISLLISYFTWCRIPIASVVAPLFIEKNTDIVRTPDQKACCAPQMTLEDIELNSPMVKGFAYGFYLFFSTVFGLLVSIGFASIC